MALKAGLKISFASVEFKYAPFDPLPLATDNAHDLGRASDREIIDHQPGHDVSRCPRDDLADFGHFEGFLFDRAERRVAAARQIERADEFHVHTELEHSFDCGEVVANSLGGVAAVLHVVF